MILNTVTFLLGVGLILLYSGLADGAITNFQCTNESVCAGDRVECSCTTDSGTLDWSISYSEVEPLKWNPILNCPMPFNYVTAENEEYCYGYNFTFNTAYTGLNTSILTFNLNQSESVLIECANGNEFDKMNTTVTDSGFYAEAPTNLTTAFTTSGVTLQWEDTGNNCTSTVYNVTLNSTSTSALTYNNDSTTLHINSSELNTTETYTYTVKGWNEQQSNISTPFTLAPHEVMSVTIDTTNTTDPCKNNSCCVNVTLNIILASSNADVEHPSQYYSISYNSNTGNTYNITTDYDETKWTGELKYNETYCFTITPMNDFNTGMPISNDTMTTGYQCQPPGNGGDNNDDDDKPACGTGCIVVSVIGVVFIIVIIIVIVIIVICRWRYINHPYVREQINNIPCLHRLCELMDNIPCRCRH